jgi:hypothetical protein
MMVVGSPTIGCLIDETDTDSAHHHNHELAERFYAKQEQLHEQQHHNIRYCQSPQHQQQECPQEIYDSYTKELYCEASYKYISITLQNAHTIVLSLEDGLKHQLEILKVHQLPIPGCSEGILPMYDIEVQVVGSNVSTFSNGKAMKPSTTTNEPIVSDSSTQSHYRHINDPFPAKSQSESILQYQPSTEQQLLQQKHDGAQTKVSSPNPSRIGLTPRGIGVSTPRESKVYKPSFQFPPPLQQPLPHQNPLQQSHGQSTDSPIHSLPEEIIDHSHQLDFDHQPSNVSSPRSNAQQLYPFPNSTTQDLNGNGNKMLHPHLHMHQQQQLQQNQRQHL